jgi:hypothetical protein
MQAVAWGFFSPAPEHRTLIVSTLKDKHDFDLTKPLGQGNPRVKRKKGSQHFFWSHERLKQLQSELPAAAYKLVLQHHMDVVSVPIGWFHAVTNLQPCLKLAVETIHPEQFDLMQGVALMQCELPGLKKAPDYVAALNLVLAAPL